MSPFLIMLLFLKTQSTLVRGRMTICSFILLLCQLLLLVPSLTKPPITKVYTRCQYPLVSSPLLAASTSNPVLSDDLSISLRKGKRQYTHPISSFCSYDHLSSHSCSFFASLDSILLLNKVFDALTHPGCSSVMIDEMDALTNNGT